MIKHIYFNHSAVNNNYPEIDDYHGYDFADHCDFAASGRRAHLATQPQLGVWSQWWLRTGVADLIGALALGIPPTRLLNKINLRD